MMDIKSIFLFISAAFIAGLMLLFLDINTLFLATILVAIYVFKSQKYGLDKVVAIWFAMSVAPAYGIEYSMIFDLSNGFLIQSLCSLLFTIALYIKKPSVIGRLYNTHQQGVLFSAILVGFGAGIMSASLWQIVLL
jgi:phosphatidylglycerophosphatase A